MVSKQLAALSKKGGTTNITADPIFAPFASSMTAGTKKEKRKKKDPEKVEPSKKKRKSTPTKKPRNKK